VPALPPSFTPFAPSSSPSPFLRSSSPPSLSARGVKVAGGAWVGRNTFLSLMSDPSRPHSPHFPFPAPYTLHPAPCTLHPTHYTLNPTPCTLHSALYTLHPTPTPNTLSLETLRSARADPRVSGKLTFTRSARIIGRATQWSSPASSATLGCRV